MYIDEENSNWLDSIKILLENLKFAEFKNKDFIFKDKIIILNPQILEDPFKTCCYFNSKTKIKQLTKHYFNEDNWKNLFDKENSEEVIIEIKTEKKSPCFYKLIINHKLKKVKVYFRKSDFLKKFRIDLYFIKEILNKFGLQDYKISECILEETFLRMFYILILLKALNEEELRFYCENNLFFKESIKMLNEENIKNQKGTSKYKMLKRWIKYTVESEYWNILKEYI